jgi:hypothetical protein
MTPTAIAAWLQRADHDGSLAAFLKPILTPSERTVAQVEGWILGVPALIRSNFRLIRESGVDHDGDTEPDTTLNVGNRWVLGWRNIPGRMAAPPLAFPGWAA